MPESHILSALPCTRYWHYERQANVDGLRPPGIPHWLRRFDWLVGWQHGWADLSTFPKHVFCHPNSLTDLARFLEANYEPRKCGSFLVSGGEDTHLSHQDPKTIASLNRFFDRIFYEAYDVPHPLVEVMPIGLQEFYLRGAEEYLHSATTSSEKKSKLLLSSFGKYWPNLNESIEDRKLAVSFTNKSNFTTKGPFERQIYFEKLAEHKFMICPLGNGIQSPKIFEAFLTRCIPIMTDSSVARALVAKGAPIHVVQSWDEVTEKSLERKYPNYQQRSDKFFRTACSLNGYWDFSFGYRPM